MGRAIVRQPQVFLMDEPLSNLDAKLRVQTRTQIASLQRRLGVTTVYVTHDQIEAMTMGDRVCVLKDGILQQCDTPRVLYDTPDNVFVAGFIGSPAMNIADFKYADGHAQVGMVDIPLSRGLSAAIEAEGADQVTLGFRPESLELVGKGDGFPVVVNVVEELGSDAFLFGTLQARDEAAAAANPELAMRDIIARVDPRTPPMKGETVYLRVREGENHAFSVKTGKRFAVERMGAELS
jgi:multiple sugar transport system ATP-binding protein